MIRKLLFILTIITSCLSATAQPFCIKQGENIHIFIPKAEAPVANTALEMLKGDAKAVLSSELLDVQGSDKADIVCAYDGSMEREGFLLNVKDCRLHITAADAHGMAYGLLEVSRLMGVSPWEWWADCSAKPLKQFCLKEGYCNSQHPAVAYRGIFINDEDWGLLPWATQREPEAFTIHEGRLKGAVGPKTTEKIFQLLLRLRANYYWPPMHECTQPFFLTDGNREVAAKYGIYIGGSHCEPMACSAAAEWGLRGKGDYNYITNKEAVQQFWQQRLDEVKNQEILYTIGMRGVHDGAMQGVKTLPEKLNALQQVIYDQRDMFEKTRPGMADGKQLFVPYKEVLEVYKAGLKVPDDVTLMWTDDNYGYIRHFPDSVERARKGGNALYYHVSYWGAPQDYLWLGSFSPYLLNQQMTEAYNRGIRQVWVLNVGDIKPAEFLIEEWMDLAWQGPNVESSDEEEDLFVTKKILSFYQREFGVRAGKRIADMMTTWHHLAFERRPEFMANTRVYEKDRAWWAKPRAIPDWTIEDVKTRVSSYQKISDEAEAIEALIPANRKAAYFEMVKYQVQAAAQLNFKFLCPDRKVEAYDSIAALTRTYNNGVDGQKKWNGMMDMAPRQLPVFAPLDTVLTYPEATKKQTVLLSSHHSLQKGKSITVSCRSDETDSVTLELAFLPTFPIDSDRLAVTVEAGGWKRVVEYQTKDHTEEWKQNVLRNKAMRTVVVPAHGKKKITVTVTALDDGIELYRITAIANKK